MTDSEDILAQIWKEVLKVEQVNPDDDFFSLGGDSLLAITVVGAAAERDIPLTLLDLFKNPTLRGCRQVVARAGDPQPSVELLSPLDQARVPEGVERAWPAARLQLGLIYESLLSAGGAYVDVISRRVNRPLDPSALRAALDLMARRHPVLRSRFDLASFSEPMQLVETATVIPLELADADEHEEVMRRLAEPFDPETAPLLRVHAVPSGPDAFRFSYAFHHAILDGWSEAVFFNELVRSYAGLLEGDVPEFPQPISYAEFVRLERAALADEETVRYFHHLWGEPSERQETAPKRTVRCTAGLALPETYSRTLTEHAAAWGLPVKSLLLTVCCAAVGAVEGTTTPVVSMVVNGRPEMTGSEATLGLFLNQLPLRLDLRGTTWREAARRALDAERGLLPHRRFPHSELRRVLGPEPFTANFNYVHFHPRDDLLAAGLVASEEDMRDYTSLAISVEALNDPLAGGLGLRVTADAERFGEDFAQRLLHAMRTAVSAMVENPDEQLLTINAEP
ncbi:condensation domain-containing protein [Actinomadura sp. 6K520]|uniref:condensation domain-containing protein n=1 Tax=Actinomadura sp. 6K520 TaxID=2530364 RepID=UPI001044095A|nr:condensation domain-containing protein [Actinomadura sp. 6K520]TDE32833.1 hypothetical protein E1289_14370 [Actinomadura sp. 6K520]